MQFSIVLDTGFGDAGKGLTVDFLASRSNEKVLVCRFSGGHQVGHTVALDKRRHTFSNFGAGTFRGIPTYYSEYTTIFPPATMVEYEHLRTFQPQLFVHPLCMVTTMYDVAYNRASERLQKHGSCGVGFGATIERNAGGVTLYAKDLLFPWMFEQRLQGVKHYYEQKIGNTSQPGLVDLYKNELEDYDEEKYIEFCQQSLRFTRVIPFGQLYNSYQHIIFEGSQGILLDQAHGIHPHTTWSGTTSQNALSIIQSVNVDIKDIEIYYVSRCYQTRHGNGPMSNNEKLSLINTEGETNIENDFQGAFRVSKLDPGLIRYSIMTDQVYHGEQSIRKNLVITCLDQLPGFDIDELLNQLPFDFCAVWTSYGPGATDVSKFR